MRAPLAAEGTNGLAEEAGCPTMPASNATPRYSTAPHVLPLWHAICHTDS